MNDHRFDDIPMVLETVNPDLWPDEIRCLYALCRAGC
jgi:deoxyribonuclease-4